VVGAHSPRVPTAGPAWRGPLVAVVYELAHETGGFIVDVPG